MYSFEVVDSSTFEAMFVRAGFRRRQALGYATCKASPNPLLEEDGRVF
jgi:hypothetical protein